MAAKDGKAVAQVLDSKRDHSEVGRRRPFQQPALLGGVLLFKSHAHHRAEYGDACEENNKGGVVSAQNLSEPKQKVTDNQVE
jgi:hypothetical protein